MIDILIGYLVIGLIVSGITVIFRVNGGVEDTQRNVDEVIDDLMLSLDEKFGKPPKSLRYTVTLAAIIIVIIL